MAVPSIVYQSASFVATIASQEYPPDGWIATLALIKSGETDVSIVGTDAGDGQTYRFSATPAATTAWATGSWRWAVAVTDGTDVHVVCSGTLTVEVTGGSATELETATDYLNQVRAALGAAIGKPSSYSIKDRSLTNRSIAELTQLENVWAQRVSALQAQADRECGSKTGNRRITYGTFK